MTALDQAHPLYNRKRASARFHGAWSARLKNSGFHTNHIHESGWLSSACYISLPSVIERQTSKNEGWIQFGQPDNILNLTLEPRKMIQPKVGHLVLFPSYMWHGTIPFNDEQQRLTVAFDVIPQ